MEIPHGAINIKHHLASDHLPPANSRPAPPFCHRPSGTAYPPSNIRLSSASHSPSGQLDILR
jgi:hypothetical protein